MLHFVAVAHGLARPEETKIGSVDSPLEGGRFDAFTKSALAEADKLSPNQPALYVNKPPRSSFDMLVKAQVFGGERPPILLSAVVKEYLKDRERRSSYADLEKQTNLVVSILKDAKNTKDPSITSIDRVAAYAFRDKLIAKGNAYSPRFRLWPRYLNHKRALYSRDVIGVFRSAAVIEWCPLCSAWGAVFASPPGPVQSA